MPDIDKSHLVAWGCFGGLLTQGSAPSSARGELMCTASAEEKEPAIVAVKARGSNVRLEPNLFTALGTTWVDIRSIKEGNAFPPRGPIHRYEGWDRALWRQSL